MKVCAWFSRLLERLTEDEEAQGKILMALEESPAMSGYQLARATRMAAGRTSRALLLLEARGAVTAAWEPPEHAQGHPTRKRLYRKAL